MVTIGGTTEAIRVPSDTDDIGAIFSQTDVGSIRGGFGGTMTLPDRFTTCWAGFICCMSQSSEVILTAGIFGDGLIHPEVPFLLLMMMKIPPIRMRIPIPPTLPQSTIGEENNPIHELLGEDSRGGIKSLSRKIRRVKPTSSFPKFIPKTTFLRSDSLA